MTSDSDDARSAQIRGKTDAAATARPHFPERQQAIDEFLERWAPGPDKDLLAEMLVTVCRLARERTGRGELKMINKALKELRYAFKTFAPYQHIRKVSIFGSSRTPESHPEYEAAVCFASRMRE